MLVIFYVKPYNPIKKLYLLKIQSIKDKTTIK
jgi:DUF1365 family protein